MEQGSGYVVMDGDQQVMCRTERIAGRDKGYQVGTRVSG
jgi:hypothetical protein